MAMARSQTDHIKGGTEMISLIPLWKLLFPGLIAGLGMLYQIARRRTEPGCARPGHPSWLASLLEVKAYYALERIYPQDRYLISAHMGLIDVIGRSHLETLSLDDRRFAWRAHCDFVIVDRRTLTIQKVIEVNGPRHGNPEQALRDRHKLKILTARGIAFEIW